HISVWGGLFVPKGTPKSVIAKAQCRRHRCLGRSGGASAACKHRAGGCATRAADAGSSRRGSKNRHREVVADYQSGEHQSGMTPARCRRLTRSFRRDHIAYFSEVNALRHWSFSSDIFGTAAKGSAMPKSSPQVALHYADYLKLAGLLAAQQPESARHGRLAHDEMLFIIVHQTYELWFKQILHELDRIQLDFGGDVVEDEYLGRIVHGLERINEILKLLIQQLEVLETMTPLDFLDFRDFLFPASGFQSGQFRLIEIRLGLARGARSQYA